MKRAAQTHKAISIIESINILVDERERERSLEIVTVLSRDSSYNSGLSGAIRKRLTRTDDAVRQTAAQYDTNVFHI